MVAHIGSNIYAFYCAFDIFKKAIYGLALYTEEVNLQILSYFNEKPFVVTTYVQNVLFWSMDFKKSDIFTFSP